MKLKSIYYILKEKNTTNGGNNGRQQKYAESASFGYNGGERADEPARRAENRAASPLNDPVKLRVPEEVLRSHGSAQKLLMHLTDIMSLYPGDRDVLVYLPGQKPVRCNADRRITFTDDLRNKLVRMLGAENVKG